MAGLFDKQADLYLDSRPTYPKEGYSKLADLTPHLSLAWDVGTGNGQATIGVAEHYKQVIGTDVTESQLQRAMPHPLVRYAHTPLTMTEDELIALIGGESSVDLPGGVLAVWCYNHIEVCPEFDPIVKRLEDTTLPYYHHNIQYVFDGYKTLPFPFQSAGFGCEGSPLALDIPKKLSFEGFLKMVRSWSAVNTAKEQGVDLLPEKLVKEFEVAWGGTKLVRSVSYKAFMLAGKVKV
ncbi:hypothetical protein ACFXTH_001166 [Malus domestica]